ncbi:MAG: autotransporter assembly complex family protein [Pseudohongiellaceae bacterium]
MHKTFIYRRQYLTAYLSLMVLVYVGNSAFAQQPALAVSGANELLSENIKSHVTFPNLTCDVAEGRLTRLLPSIRQQVVRAGRGLGYYRLVQQTDFLREDDCWQLMIEVEPGDPVLVAGVAVDIVQDASAFTEIVSDLPLKIGDQLNQGEYERIKARLSTHAIEQGYFSAHFEYSELRLDLQANSAEVVISFDPGARFSIGAISVEDTEFLAANFIRRYLSLSRGDPYSSNSLLTLRDTLNDSLYFSRVTVTPDPANALNDEVPITIGLSLRPQRAYSIGGGLTTDIGPRLRADYENRYLNKEGHRVEANGGASPIRSNLDMRYRIPLADPATESLVLSAGVLSEDTDSFNSDTFKVAAAYNSNTVYDWRRSLFVDYQYDNFELSGSEQTSDLLIAGVSLNRTEADNALYPSRGWRMFGQLRGASADVLSPESFLQLNLAGKLITPIGPGRLLLKAELGATLVDDINNLPISIQYFAGGDQSVRGYKYQSLGPSNDVGDVLGGKHLFSAGIEYDFFVLPSWKLAVFSDAGNAFDDFSDLELNRSLGIGLRWLSPIGPIRVDLASAIDGDNDFRVHITMGPDL